MEAAAVLDFVGSNIWHYTCKIVYLTVSVLHTLSLFIDRSIRWRLTSVIHQNSFHSMLKARKFTVHASCHGTCRYQKQPHIWNSQPQFAYSLWHLYGAPVRNKGCLLLKLLMLKAKSRENLVSPVPKVPNFWQFTGSAGQGFEIHCLKKPGLLLHFQITPTILVQYQQILAQRIVN